MNISIAAEPIFHVGSFPITNSVLSAWATLVIWSGIAIAVRVRPVKLVPIGIQNFFELLFERMFSLVDQVTGNREQSKKFFPLVATIFLYIIVANWLGLLPGLGTVGWEEVHEGTAVIVPFLRAATADLNTTLAIAVIAVVAIQFFGIVGIGLAKYGKKFINFSSPIKFFVGLLELISEISRLISFSFRLFGNIFAGEVLLVVITSLLPWIAPLPFYFLELFVGFIQALVFAMLTLVFLKIATLEGH